MIAFGAGLTVRYHSWTDWKIIQSAKSLVAQYDDDGAQYTIYGYDGPEVHTCTIWKGDIPDGVAQGSYTQANNDTDRADFEAHKARYNRPLAPRANDGRPKGVVDKSEDDSVTLYSHDWTDRTTWRETAARVVDEVATDSGDHRTYTLAHQAIIDTYHGKITGEDFLKDATGNSHRVVVKVNGNARVEQDPHYGAGGDFVVNYDAGTITFLAALDPADAVTVTYHYAVNSLFTIQPSTGKKLIISLVEAQFSMDVVLSDTVVFQPYGYVDAFAPQLLQANGGPLPSGTKIPLGAPNKYKSMTDYQNEAMRAYPRYPAMGGAGWRGASQDILVMDWDYLKAKPLYSSAGMEIRISLEHDTPFDGFYATATFYCGTENE